MSTAHSAVSCLQLAQCGWIRGNGSLLAPQAGLTGFRVLTGVHPSWHPLCRQLQACCAAHAAALLACDAHCPMEQHGVDIASSLLLGLSYTIALGPRAVALDPALQQLFRRLWDSLGVMVSGTVAVTTDAVARLSGSLP